MSLYKRLRPSTLDEVVGNDHIKSALGNILVDPVKNGQVFLFTGPSGCGKTTFGRIIKNVLEVDDTDYKEINSSDFRGIDMIRELNKNSQFSPAMSEWRIFLIDEVHQLTKDAQNAFLKILEDTPHKVIFILCTTDPQNLLAAVKNRCKIFEVNMLDDDEMGVLIKKCLRKEKTPLEQEVIKTIINNAKGSPREALQILEKVLNTEPDLRLEMAQKHEAVESQAIELARALMNSKTNWKQYQTILEGLKSQNAESIRRVILGYCQAILLKGANDRAAYIMETMMEPNFTNGFPQLVYQCYYLHK